MNCMMQEIIVGTAIKINMRFQPVIFFGSRRLVISRMDAVSAPEIYGLRFIDLMFYSYHFANLD